MKNHQIPTWLDDSSVEIINYSTLVRDAHEEIERICPRLELEMSPQMSAFVRRSTRPRFDWLRGLWGPRKLYFSVARRCPRPDTAWKQELTSASIRRVLKIVEQFPLEWFWADDD